MRPIMLFPLVLAACSTALGQNPRPEPETKTKNAPPFVLERRNEPVEFTFKGVKDDDASKEERKFGVEWSIVENTTRLTRLFWRSGEAPYLTIGKGSENNDLVVLRRTTAKIHDEPGELGFTVHPTKRLRELPAGVYQGMLKIRLDPGLDDGGTKLLPIRITLVLTGSTLVGASWVDARQGMLRVGSRASIEVEVEDYARERPAATVVSGTVNTLEARLDPAGSAETVTLASFTLPGPVGDPPARAMRAGETWAWRRDEPIQPPRVLASATEELKIGIEGCRGRRSKILAPLPMLSRVGDVTGTVVWGDEKRDLPKTPVRSGLRVYEPFALAGAPAHIGAVFDAGTPGIDRLGDELPVNVSGPSGFAEQHKLIRVPRNGYVLFQGEFVPPATGSYSVAIAPTEAVAASKVELPPAVTLWAPIEVRTAVPTTEPMVVFMGARPPIRLFQSEDSVCLRQRDALDLTLRNPTPMRIRLEGIYHDEDSDAPSPHQAGAEPSLALVDAATVSSDDRALLATMTTPAESREIPPSATAKFDLIAHVADRTDPPPLKTWSYRLRWLIEGTDPEGKPIARFFDQPIEVRVASQTEMEFLLYWIVPAAFVVLLVLIVVWLRRSGGSSRRAPSVAPLGSFEAELERRSREAVVADDDDRHQDRHVPAPPASRPQPEDRRGPEPESPSDTDSEPFGASFDD